MAKVKSEGGASGEYTAKNLAVLEGLEAVRKRPGMYIGSNDSRGLMHCLWEIVDNGVDEALAGFYEFEKGATLFPGEEGFEVDRIEEKEGVVLIEICGGELCGVVGELDLVGLRFLGHHLEGGEAGGDGGVGPVALIKGEDFACFTWRRGEFLGDGLLDQSEFLLGGGVGGKEDLFLFRPIELGPAFWGGGALASIFLELTEKRNGDDAGEGEDGD